MRTAITPPIPPWLETARSLVEAGRSQTLRMRAIASTVGIHPVHLSRAFHRRFGITMSGYRRALRLEAARSAIGSTTHSIARIAAEHGFSDQAHLTRAFKRANGLTPSAFRRIHGRQAVHARAAAAAFGRGPAVWSDR
jgi:AraC family transcriptional regulator